MKITMRYRNTACLLCGLLLALPQIVEGSTSTTLTVKVAVVEPPSCIINDNRAIIVNFGNMMINEVNGSNYRMPVVYTLSCTVPSLRAKISIQGDGASFDGAVLKTSEPGLGIKFLRQDSVQLAINKWLNFVYPDKPELWAVPVKQSGATLHGGEFTAGATMKVDYQ